MVLYHVSDGSVCAQMPLQRRRRRSHSREFSDDYKRARLAPPRFYTYSRDEHPAAVANIRYRCTSTHIDCLIVVILSEVV